jgi:hypothetical protein
MWHRLSLALGLAVLLYGCRQTASNDKVVESMAKAPILTLAKANALADLPLGCLHVQYPNKLGQTLNDSTHLGSPRTLHPSFFGCFDWHSSVHGHWSLVALLKKFPNLEKAAVIRSLLARSLSKENLEGELAYFQMTGNTSFERTYGWAWILKLAEELHSWNDPMARKLEANLQPLARFIVEAYSSYLPKLNYPVRVGEHSNTAFGLSLAWDYAVLLEDGPFMELIGKSVDRFYANDHNCPMEWEPSGYDFLSPCLQEADLVRKVYGKERFKTWLTDFMPQIAQPGFVLAPGEVSDRTDGKLVHLDGLNFSRAWCLYGIAGTLPEYPHLKQLANAHLEHSLPNLMDGNYEGTHWLGTFALYALNTSN